MKKTMTKTLLSLALSLLLVLSAGLVGNGAGFFPAARAEGVSSRLLRAGRGS